MEENDFYLAQSKIAGVGIFSKNKIPKNCQLNLFFSEIKYFDQKEYANANDSKKWFINTYCVAEENGFSCPLNFQCMDIGWYLNHSNNPNAYHNDDFIYFSSRTIEKDEEITIDYRLLSQEESKNFKYE